jgi:GntR family transcriptional repressor for pyruvate dehydrogenase complex
MAVTHCSNNPYFIRLMEHLSFVFHNAVRTLRYQTTGTERIGHVETEHHDIFEAIRDRDAMKARLAMRHHLSNGMERYENLNRKK